MKEIKLETRVSSVAKLRTLLLGTTLGAVELQLRGDGHGERGIDPSVLVAIVGGVSANLTALITALLTIRKQANAKTIVLQGKSGKRLEISGDYSATELDRLMDAVHLLDVEKVVLDK